MLSEINHANEMLAKKDTNFNVKNLEFKRSILKSTEICIAKIINIEFKFKFAKKISLSKMINYQNILEISEFLDENNSADVKRIQMLLNKAIEAGRLEIVKYFVENGADVNSRDGDYYPLMIACRNGYLEIVKYLIDNGADIKATGNKSTTALIFALREGHFGIVKCLVGNGADINKHGGFWRENALIIASKNGNLEMVKYLVENGSNLNAGSRCGTALMMASEKGHIKIVEYLVEKGADINQK